MLDFNKREEMTVKELIAELAKYPEDMEVAVTEGFSRTIPEGELVLDPYTDYNLLVITYNYDEEE